MTPDQRLELYKGMSPIARNIELRTLFEALPVLRPLRTDSKMGRLLGQSPEIDDLTVVDMLNQQLMTRASRASGEILAVRVDALAERMHITKTGAKFLTAQYRQFQTAGIEKPNTESQNPQVTTWDRYKNAMDWSDPIGAGVFGESTAQVAEITLYQYEAAKAMKAKMDAYPIENDPDLRDKLGKNSAEKKFISASGMEEVTITPLNMPLEGIMALVRHQLGKDRLIREWRQDIIDQWKQEP